MMTLFSPLIAAFFMTTFPFAVVAEPAPKDKRVCIAPTQWRTLVDKIETAKLKDFILLDEDQEGFVFFRMDNGLSAKMYAIDGCIRHMKIYPPGYYEEFLKGVASGKTH